MILFLIGSNQHSDNNIICILQMSILLKTMTTVNFDMLNPTYHNTVHMNNITCKCSVVIVSSPNSSSMPGYGLCSKLIIINNRHCKFTYTKNYIVNWNRKISDQFETLRRTFFRNVIIVDLYNNSCFLYHLSSVDEDNIIGLKIVVID